MAPDLVDDPQRTPTAEPVRALVTARRRISWARHATFTAVSLGALGTFMAVERTFRGARANAFDRAVMKAAGRARRPWLTFAARAVTALGGVPGAITASLGMIFAMRKTPRAAAQIALGALGGVVAELGLKQIFGRERPDLLPHLEHVSSKSFPSGHAMASSSLYLTLALVSSRGRRLRDHRTLILTGACAVAATIGLTRVYLGVHFPTDVLGGLALGTAWAAAMEAAFDWSAAHRVERALAIGPVPA